MIFNYLCNDCFTLADHGGIGAPIPVPYMWPGANYWHQASATAETTYERLPNALTGETVKWLGHIAKSTNPGKILVGQMLPGIVVQAMIGKQANFTVSMLTNITRNMNIVILSNSGTEDVVADYITAWNGDGITPTFALDTVAFIQVPQSANVWSVWTVSGTVPANCKNLVTLVCSDTAVQVGDFLRMSRTGFYTGSKAYVWQPAIAGLEVYRSLTEVEL